MKDLCIICLADKYRNMSFQDLLDLSLPFVEVTFDGTVHVAKAEATAGVLNFSTCAEQLLYEVGDPGAYITPDVVILVVIHQSNLSFWRKMIERLRLIQEVETVCSIRRL